MQFTSEENPGKFFSAGMLTFGHCLALAGFLSWFLSQRLSSKPPSVFVSVGVAISLMILMSWTLPDVLTSSGRSIF